ncbi:hypothetical protein HMPREF9943_01288 [Eggerthia catenaformis OT 569 = DSM 20559]|uniref:Cell division protein FtsX n=1 Tax=Eggerthia catenaformis OT 569 = DSM 20559 TaxID=999415 RepID=M2P7R9_9FIRM|nr:permease-like cell division protein FtsX [Eggerthia catenaformis]EMD16362.1 hypothetical protein HMPREF9943_01288 [Eggerthia catenaformis OT 569 = DSM 20559]OUC51068.1 ABC transporter permease [Eggerthia catenaformis]
MNFLRGIRNLPRHAKTAMVSIWRNGVMSFSSIVAVTITLLLIAIVGSIAVNVNEITVNIEKSLNIYVKVEREATDEQSKAIGEQLKKIPNIKKITYSSKQSELEKLIQSQQKENKKLFENYRKDNPLGDAYVVEVTDAKKLEKAASQIEKIEHVKEVTYGGGSTSKLVKILEGIRNGGAVFVVALIALVLFMIANTIKMAITARSTEIAIMRMVGASNWYIRIPFMLEGAFIGLLGSILPIIVLYYGYTFTYSKLTAVVGSGLLAFREPFPLIWQLSGMLLLLGGLVGLIGSFFSVRKFLNF